jgi:predicted nucleic acid-binding Zn ribbon protein
MNKGKGTLTSLKDIIGNLMGDGTLPFHPEDAAIWKIWDEVAGHAISKNARPYWIKDGKLRVIVKDPIWLQELEFVKSDIKNKLNDKLGREAVKDISFRLGH